MKAARIEEEMIRQDMEFCLGVGQSNPDLPFQYFPYICLIVLESCKYFQITVEDLHLESIRAKAKQLDDTKLDIPESINLLKSIHLDHNRYYASLPRGRFIWLKRLLQKDLGEYRYKGRFLSTTLLNNYLVSLSSRNTAMDELMEGKAFDVGHSVGVLIGSMLRENKINVKYPADPIVLLEQDVSSKDYNSKRYFKTKYREDLAPEIIHLFQLYSSMLNFCYYILTPEKIDGFTLFKIRFVTLYHFVSSMKKFQSYFYLNGLASHKNQEFFSSICSDSFSKNLLSNKRFRNVLVHYELAAQEVEVDLSDLVSGLAAHAYRGSDTLALKSELDLKIQSTIEILDNWMLRT